MNLERKIIDKAAILRMMRAATGMDQSAIAKLADISRRTMLNAESGTLSQKTFDKLIAIYGSAGLRFALLPGCNGEPVAIIAFDSDIAPVIDAKA
jgi:DNA-binding XRE family transcriptional regulator